MSIEQELKQLLEGSINEMDYKKKDEMKKSMDEMDYDMKDMYKNEKCKIEQSLDMWKEVYGDKERLNDAIKKGLIVPCK